MAKRVSGKSYSEIAKDLAPHLGVDENTARIYVYRWLNSEKVPSQKALTAIHRAGYPIEPFVFGLKKWQALSAKNLAKKSPPKEKEQEKKKSAKKRVSQAKNRKTIRRAKRKGCNK